MDIVAFSKVGCWRNDFSNEDIRSPFIKFNMSHGCTAFWSVEALRDVGIFASSVWDYSIANNPDVAAL